MQFPFSARSPVYSHLSATLIGLPIIRAFKVQNSFINDFYRYQDHQTSAWMLYIGAHRWLGARLDWCIAFYLSGCILAAFLTAACKFTCFMFPFFISLLFMYSFIIDVLGNFY